MNISSSASRRWRNRSSVSLSHSSDMPTAMASVIGRDWPINVLPSRFFASPVAGFPHSSSRTTGVRSACQTTISGRPVVPSMTPCLSPLAFHSGLAESSQRATAKFAASSRILP